jgi:hypothetical protein
MEQCINIFMDFINIKAAAIDLNIDDERLTSEIMSIPDDKWTPSEYDILGSDPWKTIWLRVNNKENIRDFKSAKSVPHQDWCWDSDLNINYLKSVLENLPFKTIGMIRAFSLSGSIAMHVDSNDTTPTELTYNVGLTLAPNLEMPMSLDGIEIKEKYVLFNDSLPHGFPNATRPQISIRIFGDIEYDKLKIIKIYR